MDSPATTYYSLSTHAGDAKLSRALALGLAQRYTTFVLGDANGAEVVPTKDMTALVHQVHQGAITSLQPDAANPDWFVAEIVVPAEVGGWTVREIGLRDEDGDLVFVGNLPVGYKPVLAQGSGREMVFRMVIEVGSAANVVLKIDPAIAIASRNFVENAVASHEAKTDPHPQYSRRRPAFDFFRLNF